MVEMARMWSLC